ncbi:hypothetical protein AAC691_03155 [Nguyenibacter vanlangensis]|uniref:Uncharacterized protein n=1 Tax=Nguyenibacter vanlangensis TaxID=1216886 RepID=A0ABZ3D769_9PROT
MPDSPSKAWFAAKRYGYGAGRPIAWQGWAVLAVFVAILVSARAILGFLGIGRAGMVTTIIDAVALAVLLAICALKTEGGWRWRWGERR